MKKALRIILIVLLALVILATAFTLLYRRFVANRIMDRGGMENPFLEEETAENLTTDVSVERAACSGTSALQRSPQF